ncbi:MAG: hypothetical protein VYB54_00310 [Pseudomonadota bacterium]|nr:hypothetical protein [Pseudomonadota bacterium]
MTGLGELREVSLREAWGHEAHDFTPWLGENLGRLGDLIGLQLEFVGREVAVDRFSADIVARDIQTGDVVLIENQLERSDHTHLGQILTYLSGTEAQTVIWVASGFEDAHLSAINWLNEHTTDAFAFFAVRLKLLRIDGSLPAPLFEVVARPNRWDRKVRAGTPGVLSETGAFRRAFWGHLIARHPEHWPDWEASGTSSIWRWNEAWELCVVLFVSKTRVGVFLRGERGTDPAETEEYLEPYRAVLEKRLGVPMQAHARDYLFTSRMAGDTSDRANWDRLTDWLDTTAMHYLAVLDELRDLEPGVEA